MKRNDYILCQKKKTPKKQNFITKRNIVFVDVGAREGMKLMFYRKSINVIDESTKFLDNYVDPQ